MRNLSLSFLLLSADRLLQVVQVFSRTDHLIIKYKHLIIISKVDTFSLSSFSFCFPSRKIGSGKSSSGHCVDGARSGIRLSLNLCNPRSTPYLHDQTRHAYTAQTKTASPQTLMDLGCKDRQSGWIPKVFPCSYHKYETLSNQELCPASQQSTIIFLLEFFAMILYFNTDILQSERYTSLVIIVRDIGD